MKNYYPLTAAQKMHYNWIKKYKTQQVSGVSVVASLKAALDFGLLKKCIQLEFERYGCMRLRFTKPDENCDVMQYIAYAQRGELEKCAEESFDCVSCGCCSVRCPAGISHPMVGLLARRLTGKYIAPKSEHLEKRVEEIHEGKYDDLIEQIMQKPITDMQELYNNREIEK